MRGETLSEALRDAAVDMDTLRHRYGAQIAIGRQVLGVEPNSHGYLEIWPAALRTYNLLVPNLLNLPFLLVGAGAPKATVGLAMYSASRAAGCAYCAAHCCSFALRRGADEDRVVRVAGADPAPADGAVVAVAEGLASVPATLTQDQRHALLARFSASDAEWIVLAVAMMGFLNKFMDAMGIPLEASMLATAQEVIGPAGWTPGRHGAEGSSAWLAGRGNVPARTSRPGVPYAVPAHPCPRDPRAYATEVGDQDLANQSRALAAHVAADDGEPAGVMITLARAAASSPACIPPDLVAESTGELSPPQIIELITWLGC